MAGVALESCEGAAELAEELIEGAGWPVQLAHAGYVHRMKQTPDKSDFTDARVLADLVRVGYLPEVWLPPPGVRELRRWTRAWMRWLEQAPLSEQSRLIIEDQLEDLKALERRLAKVEGRLTSLSEGDPIVRKLLAEPGIGPVTAWTLRAEMGRFERFPSGKHLSRLLRCESQERLDGRAAGGRRSHQGGQPPVAGDVDRGGPSADSSTAALAEAGRSVGRIGQAERRRGGGEPLGAVALSSDATRATGGLVAAGRMGKPPSPACGDALVRPLGLGLVFVDWAVTAVSKAPIWARQLLTLG